MPYLGKSPEFGVRERFYYTQTSAGATSISGFDDNGTSLRFTDGNYVDVYLNGVLLVDGVDYGTSTANTISSLSALADGDVIEVVAYDVFNLAKNQAEVTRTRYYKTASGSETSISGNDDSGVAISFPAGAQLDVSLNGVSLVAGTDYNTSTANTISGLSALSAGQVIEIVKYEKFVVSDTVSKSAGGAFGGAISATSFTGDGSGLTGVSAGKVLQVVQKHLTNTQETTNSTSFADTSLTQAITPSSTSSKILVTVSTQSRVSSSSDYALYGLNRSISGGSAGDLGTGENFAVNAQNGSWQQVHISFLDSPSTTAATTYTLRFKSYAGSNYVYHGWGSGTDGSSQIMILTEIAP